MRLLRVSSKVCVLLLLLATATVAVPEAGVRLRGEAARRRRSGVEAGLASLATAVKEFATVNGTAGGEPPGRALLQRTAEGASSEKPCATDAETPCPAPPESTPPAEAVNATEGTVGIVESVPTGFENETGV